MGLIILLLSSISIEFRYLRKQALQMENSMILFQSVYNSVGMHFINRNKVTAQKQKRFLFRSMARTESDERSLGCC